MTHADDRTVHRALDWFELNSGWAPPDEETLAEWVADGVCRCPDDCLVKPEEACSHGLASWHTILAATAESDALRRVIPTRCPPRQ